MDCLWIPARADAASDTLVVMLPGVNCQPRDFVTHGFVDDLHQQHPSTAAVLVDSHMGYFGDRSILARLQDQVLQPARERGFARIWLLGISLGGMAALGCAARQGASLAGVLTLAPYLGLRSLLAEMRAAGGPQAWSALPSSRRLAGDTTDLARELWIWLAEGPHPLPIHLGYGRADRFADSHADLARLLPPSHCLTADGGHDWPVWRGLWQRWLTQRALATVLPG